MAEKIVMIALSPTMEVGTIANWLKKENDSVASGDVLCEVETDKASMEYESAQEGVLLKIIKEQGSNAKIGDAIAIIGEKNEDINALMKEIQQESAATVTNEPAAVPAAPSPSAPSSAARPLSATAVPSASLSAVPSASLSAAQSASLSAAPSASLSAAPSSASLSAAPSAADGWVSSSPLARKIASYHRIDMSGISGSGPSGRVVKRDVEQALTHPSPRGQRFVGGGSGGFGSGGFTDSGGARRGDITVPVSGIRKVIARRTAESKYSAPHYYLSLAIHMQSTITARSALNATLKKQGKKVSFNAFLLKFSAEALRRHPEVNSSWEGEVIRQFGNIDIGLTVDMGNGLITPIVRNCESKGIVEIDDELNLLIEKARSGSLKSNEYEGAGHTVSNLGSFGIDAFTAVINPPGAAVWAIGKTTPTPVVDERGQIVARPMMNTTLSCDHRVIDGKVAAEYLGTLRALMENPASLLY